MRFLTIFLGITLAASAAGAEALGTSSSAPASPDDALAAEQAAAPQQASEPAVLMSMAAATTTTSTIFSVVTALSPAITLARGGTFAISANNPFDGGDSDSETAVAAIATTDATTATTATNATDATDAGDDETIVAAAPEQAPVKVALPSKAPSEQDLRIQYQRVGRDLLKLADQRGKFDCGGVIPRFKAIKLEQALSSAASRVQLYVDLTDMAIKIDRLRGIHIDAQCLQNPLASGCM
jgi:hypothetical protein